MAANDDIEQRIAKLEEAIAERKASDTSQDALAQDTVEPTASIEDEIKRRDDEFQAQLKQEEKDRLAHEKELRDDVDKRNKDNGANDELVDPEPEPLPEPPPLHNDTNNVHNDGSLDGTVGEVQDGHSEPVPLEDVVNREQEERSKWLEEHGMSPQAPEVQPVVTE